MKIKFNKYVIVTKRKPIEFIDADCYETSNIEEAMLIDSEEIANDILKTTLDNPEDLEVLYVSITYEM